MNPNTAELEKIIEKVISIHADVALPDQSETRKSTEYHEGFDDCCLQWDLIMTGLPRKIALELTQLITQKQKEAVEGFIRYCYLDENGKKLDDYGSIKKLDEMSIKYFCQLENEGKK